MRKLAHLRFHGGIDASARDSKTYVHRVGRTARAGKSGKAVSVVTQYGKSLLFTLASASSLTSPADVEVYQRIERALGKKLDEYNAPRDEVMGKCPKSMFSIRSL